MKGSAFLVWLYRYERVRRLSTTPRRALKSSAGSMECWLMGILCNISLKQNKTKQKNKNKQTNKKHQQTTNKVLLLKNMPIFHSLNIEVKQVSHLCLVYQIEMWGSMDMGYRSMHWGVRELSNTVTKEEVKEQKKIGCEHSNVVLSSGYVWHPTAPETAHNFCPVDATHRKKNGCDEQWWWARYLTVFRQWQFLEVSALAFLCWLYLCPIQSYALLPNLYSTIYTLAVTLLSLFYHIITLEAPAQ